MTNRTAFLALIAFSEGTQRIKDSDNGYKAVVGGTTFDSYADHPRRKVYLPAIKTWSTAAGRYQLLARYFDAYKESLALPDFSPESQDAIALQQIKEQHALTDIDLGHIQQAIKKCSNIWASFPGAGYGQREEDISRLRLAYIAAGGAWISQEI